MVQWGCKSEDYYIRAAVQVEVFSDAKGMGGLFDTDLGKVSNDRLRGMMEKCLPYNLSFTYIKGSENSVADYGSRCPRTENEGDEFPIWRPSVCHKSRKVMEKHFDTVDPQIEMLAEMGSTDTLYQEMLKDVKTAKPAKEMGETYELRIMEGSLKDL